MTYEELMEEYKKVKMQNEELKIINSNLAIELNSLRKKIFGHKREYTPDIENGEQCSLFNDPEKIEEDLNKQVKDKIEEIVVHKKKNKKEKKSGIKKSILKDVTVERKEYVLKNSDVCPECNGNLKVVGKKVVRQEIEYVPAKFIIHEYIKYVYKCEKCGTDNSNKETPTFLESVIPNALLNHSFASPSLATEVIYQKYYLGVPLYRQEKMWDDKGLILPRNMMANWNIKIAENYLEVLWNLMLKKIKENNSLIHCDETTIQCNKEEGRNPSNKSYMWVIRSGELEDIKGVIFYYSPSRAEKIAQELLQNYKNIVVTDGYAGYNNIENIIHAECWAHMRRYFYESIPLLGNRDMDTNSLGYKGIEYCNKLFDIEREIALLSVEEKKKIRQDKSKRIVTELFNWVNEVLQTTMILNKKLKKALIYAQNQQKELSEFLNDGRIPLTNSLAERAIRPFAVHRKNWLFADSTSGAKANAIYYSIIESAKVNKLNISKYIRYLLEEIPQMKNILNEDELEKYLPWSSKLPEEIKNSTEEYKELKIDN